MQKLSIRIENDLKKSKTQTFIEPVVETFEAETLAKSIGLAIKYAYDTITSQYDAPRVVVGDVVLTDAQAKKFKLNFMDFRIEFANIREHILAQLALSSEEAGVEYIRATDINGVFKNTKSFTTEQIAAQAKERLRVVRDVTRWVKADAQDSVVPTEVAVRRLQLAEAAKQKRIAAKVS